MSKRQATEMLISLEGLVSEDHAYRKLDALLPFYEISKGFPDMYSPKGRKEKGIEFGLRCLVLQFIEDLSDREMARFLEENNAGKWFCELRLSDPAPHHSYFGNFRQRLGTKRLMMLFNDVRDCLYSMGLIREVFTFVDASQLVSKLTTWDDRDKAIKAGLEKFNNDTASKVGADKDARFGCKGQNKFWYGYKEHASVDMQSGLINKIAASPANESDAQGLKRVCPKGGAVYADKGYCVNPSQSILKRNGCHDATIKKNNMKGKNKDKDRWLSQIRSPYERIFAHRSNRVRYRGTVKVQFQVAMRALVFNLKRLVVLDVKRLEMCHV